MSTPALAPRAGWQWLSFRVGDQLYAAPLDGISEVIRDGDITPVPGAPDDILGIRLLRGRIVPVLDGCRRLGAPPTMVDPARVRIIMLACAGQLVGLRVDAVGALLCTDGGEIEPPLDSAGRRHDATSGVWRGEGGPVTLLDVRRLCRLSGEDAHVA